LSSLYTLIAFSQLIYHVMVEITSDQYANEKLVITGRMLMKTQLRENL